MRLDLGEEQKSGAMREATQQTGIKHLSSRGLQTTLIYQSLSGISKLRRPTQWPLNLGSLDYSISSATIRLIGCRLAIDHDFNCVYSVKLQVEDFSVYNLYIRILLFANVCKHIWSYWKRQNWSVHKASCAYLTRSQFYKKLNFISHLCTLVQSQYDQSEFTVSWCSLMFLYDSHYENLCVIDILYLGISDMSSLCRPFFVCDYSQTKLGKH